MLPVFRFQTCHSIGVTVIPDQFIILYKKLLRNHISGKTFLNKQLALALNVRDLLDSRARRNTTWGDGFWQYQERRWHSRSIGLMLTYNFGNNTPKRDGKDNGRTEDMGGFEDTGSGEE